MTGEKIEPRSVLDLYTIAHAIIATPFPLWCQEEGELEHHPQQFEGRFQAV
ncbi:MAG: hypothetical protein H6Q04_2735 [Acidobacteria bacterium]|jgi:hypothetical protein|nr:hypothetical protein [Acidobacteriota bacterium]